MKNKFIDPSLNNTQRLYKYMKYEHLKSFQRNGLLRISRLSYYHNIENLGKAIGDKDEGKSFVDLDIDYFEKTSENNPPSALGILFGNLGNGAIIKNLKIKNATISDRDYFCLCLSETRSKSLMADFNADSYIEIKNPIKFFKVISSSVADYNHAIFAKCDYSGRRKKYNMYNHDDDWKKHPFLKDPEYINQREVRAVWNINNTEKDHITLKCFAAIKFCKFN